MTPDAINHRLAAAFTDTAALRTHIETTLASLTVDQKREALDVLRQARAAVRRIDRDLELAAVDLAALV